MICDYKMSSKRKPIIIQYFEITLEIIKRDKVNAKIFLLAYFHLASKGEERFCDLKKNGRELVKVKIKIK